MKLKQAPGDFRVREVFTFTEDPGGDYYVHVLRKEKVDTQTALSTIVRIVGVDRADIAFAGLKDRQAQTEQWISIKGRRVDFDGHGIDLRFVGRSAKAVTSKQSEGNRFEIVVRDLDPFQAVRVRRNVPALLRTGLPNYFDDQRFGCLRHGQGFAMRSLLHGNPEEALAQILARPSPVAITGDVKLKRLLQEHWRDWEACARIARGPLHGAVFAHLRRNPEDFAGALAVLPSRMKLIHAFAYQSFLWNQAVARLLLRRLPRKELLFVRHQQAPLPVWRYLAPTVLRELEVMQTPLPGPGATGDAEFEGQMTKALVEESITRESLAQVTIPGLILRSEPRVLLVRPGQFQISSPQRDSMNDGRLALTLQFTLPRGCYATLVIKRLFAEPNARGARFPSRPPPRRAEPSRDRDALASDRPREAKAPASRRWPNQPSPTHKPKRGTWQKRP